MLAFPADMAFSKAVRSVLARDFERSTNELLFMCLFMKVRGWHPASINLYSIHLGKGHFVVCRVKHLKTVL